MLVSVLPALIIVGLMVYSVLDCVQTPAEELRFGRGMWLTVIILVPVLGPVAWLVRGRTTSPRRHAHANTPLERRPPRYTSGPDDDPDFLAELGRAQRRPQSPPKAPEPEKKSEKAEKPKKPVDEPIDPDA